MTTVTITRTLGRAEFKSRYDPGVVGIIKTVVPYQNRDFDGTTKVWTVDDLYVDDVVTALTTAGHFVGDSAIEPKTFWNTTDGPGEYAFHTAAEILRNIPPDQQGAVFRAMGRLLYPDMYGRKT